MYDLEAIQYDLFRGGHSQLIFVFLSVNCKKAQLAVLGLCESLDYSWGVNGLLLAVKYGTGVEVRDQQVIVQWWVCCQTIWAQKGIVSDTTMIKVRRWIGLRGKSRCWKFWLLPTVSREKQTDTYFLCCRIMCLMLKTLGKSLTRTLFKVSIAMRVLQSGVTATANVS